MYSKTLALSMLAAAAIPGTLAHYNFEALIVNGKSTEPYQYVRRTTNANSPITDVTSTDMRCNQGGIDADIMAATDTMAVQAGDEVGFTVNDNLGHPGPLTVYMSKAPAAAQDYEGDGDWFKVYDLTYSEITEAGIQWATFPNANGIRNFTFTLPDSLPSGEYLLRAEHVGLHAAQEVGGAQFYIGCAQISVEGSGSGSPSPAVQFPGAYDGTEPGLQINLYYPAPTTYEMYGPPSWPNACEDHTANLDGQTSDGDCTGDDGAASPAPPASGTPSTPSTPSSTSTPSVPTSAPAPPPATTSPTPTPVATPTATPGTGNSCPARRRRAKRSAGKKARKARV